MKKVQRIVRPETGLKYRQEQSTRPETGLCKRKSQIPTARPVGPVKRYYLHNMSGCKPLALATTSISCCAASASGCTAGNVESVPAATCYADGRTGQCKQGTALSIVFCVKRTNNTYRAGSCFLLVGQAVTTIRNRADQYKQAFRTSP